MPGPWSRRSAGGHGRFRRQQFPFLCAQGTFGSINLGQDIVVPSDVRITTADTNGPVYLSDLVALPAAATQAYFSARSLFAGTISNSPSRVFNRHNFTNYSENRFGSLLVTNDFGIVGGRDRKTMRISVTAFT